MAYKKNEPVLGGNGGAMAGIVGGKAQKPGMLGKAVKAVAKPKAKMKPKMTDEQFQKLKNKMYGTV